jgi:hypothetical protein
VSAENQPGASAAAQMNEVEARHLTDELKQDAKELWRGLRRAHEEGAWSALGYPSFVAYCKAEFGLSKAHAYRLLRAGDVLEVCPHVETEAQARELARLLRDHRDDILGLFDEADRRALAQNARPSSARLRGVIDEFLASVLPPGEELLAEVAAKLVTTPSPRAERARRLVEVANELAGRYLDLEDGEERVATVSAGRELSAAWSAQEGLRGLVLEQAAEVRSLANQIAQDAREARDRSLASAKEAGVRAAREQEREERHP